MREHHECRENMSHYAVRYIMGGWHLINLGAWGAPITHCPYCGVKLEALEPWPPETRVAVLRTMLEGWVEELLRHADKYFMGQLMPTVESIQAVLDDR